MSDFDSTASDLDSIALAAANGLAKRNSEREREHIQETQRRIARDTERRRQQAKTKDEERREQTQAALKPEVESVYLAHNPALTRADFEREWKARRTELIQEHKRLMSGVEPM